MLFILILNTVFQVPSTVILLLLMKSRKNQRPKFSSARDQPLPLFPFTGVNLMLSSKSLPQMTTHGS